jgi:phage RecT family recombinase
MAASNNRNASQNPNERSVHGALTIKDFSAKALKFEEQFGRLIPNTLKRNQILTGNRVIGLLINLFAQNEDIRKCRPSTVLNAAGLACAVGLEFNNALGHSAIIPYKDAASWQLMVRGGVALAIRSGKVAKIEAEVVLADDEFDYAYGTKSFLHHKSADRWQGKSMTPAEYNAFLLDSWRKAYCCVHLKDGSSPSFTVMDRAQIEYIREKSSKFKDSSDGPWKNWLESMIRKTPVKMELKVLDLTGESSMAAGFDDQGEADAPQDQVIDWKDYSQEDLDHTAKTQTQGTGESKPHGGASGTASAGDSNPPGDDPEKRASIPDTQKGPFKENEFSPEEYFALLEQFKTSGYGSSLAQFTACITRWQGTLGELKTYLASGAKD